jgi:hypothetical protein
VKDGKTTTKTRKKAAPPARGRTSKRLSSEVMLTALTMAREEMQKVLDEDFSQRLEGTDRVAYLRLMEGLGRVKKEVDLVLDG